MTTIAESHGGVNGSRPPRASGVRSPWRHRRQPPYLDQFEAECVDAVEQTMQRGLVQRRTSHYCLGRIDRDREVFKGGQERVAHPAPDPDLISASLGQFFIRLPHLYPSPSEQTRYLQPSRLTTPAHPPLRMNVVLCAALRTGE
jgi:hypothetical protein